MLSLTRNARWKPSPIKISSSKAWASTARTCRSTKANQFTGMDPLPTFIVNDVIKMSDVPSYIAEYRKHLAKIFA